jgi:hypothetical protein
MRRGGEPEKDQPRANSLTRGQRAILELARAMLDTTGNLPPLPGIFPDYPAPIVRNAADGVRELAMVRWGMPSSKQSLFEAAKRRAEKLRAKGKEVDFNELLRMEFDNGTTNIRTLVIPLAFKQFWFVRLSCPSRAPVGARDLGRRLTTHLQRTLGTSPTDSRVVPGRLPGSRPSQLPLRAKSGRATSHRTELPTSGRPRRLERARSGHAVSARPAPATGSGTEVRPPLSNVCFRALSQCRQARPQTCSNEAALRPHRTMALRSQEFEQRQCCVAVR